MNKAGKIFSLISLILIQSCDITSAADEAFKLFEEEAKVTTASRREQSIIDVPVAVEVITPEEIEATGATNLWDLLRFHPGMNVVDGHTPHSMRAIVSIRGFVEGFARNVLVLVDGRNAYSSNAGGVFWAQLPVQFQDIERIEIIRGPNAALYGTGAGLGVINIITKKALGHTEGNVQGKIGNRGIGESAESFDSSLRSFDYHLSHTYHIDSGFLSAKAIGSDTNLMNGGTANDHFQSNKANFRSHWSPMTGANLELFAGSSWNNEGTPIDNTPTAKDRFNEHFEMAKFNMKLQENSQLEITSSRKEYKDTFAPTPIGTVDHIRNYQYDEEVLNRLDWGDGRFNSTYGVSYEGTRLYSDHEFFTRSPVGYQVYRGFLNQTARLNEYLTLVGAAAWETTDKGAPHPNYQLESVLKPTQDHAFRLGYSVAHTIPTLRLQDVNELRDPNQQRVGNPNILPETLTSYETGYRGSWLDRHFEPDISLYYTLIKGIDDDVGAAANLPPAEMNTGSFPVTFLNSNQAIERGVEVQLKYKFTSKRSVYANYTYEHVTDWSQNIGEITKSVPAHTVNFGAMTDLQHGFSASFNLGYKDKHIIDNQADELAVPAYWRLDARIAYTVPSHTSVKLFISGQNLLKPQHKEFSDGLAVPRTISSGVSIKFGGMR